MWQQTNSDSSTKVVSYEMILPSKAMVSYVLHVYVRVFQIFVLLYGNPKICLLLDFVGKDFNHLGLDSVEMIMIIR